MSGPYSAPSKPTLVSGLRQPLMWSVGRPTTADTRQRKIQHRHEAHDAAHRLKPRGMANLETGMISTIVVGDDRTGWTVDQLLENLINASGSKVRLAIITGQLQSIKNGRSSSICVRYSYHC
jgi:hypothetical protein